MDNQYMDNQEMIQESPVPPENPVPQEGPVQPEGPVPQESPVPPEKPDKTTNGVVSLVLGILALCLFCTWINYVLGIISIVFGIIQLVKYRKKGMAVAGIILSAVSFVLTIILYVALIVSAVSMPSDTPSYDDYEYHNYYDDSDIDDFYKKYFYDYDSDGTTYVEPSGNQFL